MKAGIGFGAKVFLILGVVVLGGVGIHSPAIAQDSADLDKSGFVDANDQLMFLEQWHTGGAFDPSVPPNAQVIASIVNATIPGDNRPEVEFSLMDGNGNPIDPADLGSLRFTIAKIVEGDVAGKPLYTHYENYVTQEVMNQVGSATPGTVTAHQATYDAGNAADVSMLGGGNLLFKFRNAIDIQPSDMGLTHTIGAQIEYEVDGVETVANPLFNFVPNGDPVTAVRELSDTISCNACHDKLAIHGGGRQEFGLCILCHNPAPDNIDPDSGNPIDMANMIHKIHRGADLPFAATQPYIIYGFRNAEHNYSHVVFPQDIRNCDSCHTGAIAKGTGAQADQYLSTPSRRACGACHEDVNFVTGAGHGPGGGIPQADDSICANCHPTMGSEFDMSVAGAHTNPLKSTQIAGLNAEILEIQNAAPGSAPLVRFRLFENDNDPIDIGTLSSVSVNFAGPTTDFSEQKSQSATSATVEVVGTYAFQMTQVIDASATGTYAFGMEARANEYEIVAGDEKSAVRESAFNPVVYVDLVTGATGTPRRQAVAISNCNNCHDLLRLHGTLRSNAEYCVFCHRPGQTDNPFRANLVAANPTVDATPVTINFKEMIHKIHRGAGLDNGYIVAGRNGSLHDYGHVGFPGRIQNCEMCHIPDGQSIPTPDGALATVIESASPYMQVGEIPPQTAACTACHDSDAAVAHANSFVNLTGAENCADCHGKAHEWGYDIVHFVD